jgi:hypothetical protein
VAKLPAIGPACSAQVTDAVAVLIHKVVAYPITVGVHEASPVTASLAAAAEALPRAHQVADAIAVLIYEVVTYPIAIGILEPISLAGWCSCTPATYRALGKGHESNCHRRYQGQRKS